MYPIENLIFSFQSPQEVFQYTAQGKIIDIVEGETSCVIIYQQGENSYSMVFCTKRSGKYKIATAVGYHHNDFASKNGSLRVYEMKDSKDSYVVGVITIEEAEMKITDNDGSQYHNFLLHESDNGFYTYYVYGYTNNTVEESLTLSLNGSELILKKI